MDLDTFWRIVDGARSAAGDPADGDEVAARLTDGLARRSPAEIVEFAVVLEGLQDASYRWDLWAAAYLINGGCSDDGFDYFRGWLVTRGRAVWDAALADPDSLAELTELADLGGPADRGGSVLCEDLLAAAPDAYERVTGDDSAYWDALPERADGGVAGEPRGEDFDVDDEEELRSRLPRLAAVHLVPDEDDGPPAARRGFLSRFRRGS